MPNLVMMKGLPGSGKSTIAKEKYVSKGYKRINKDDLRAMLDDSKWSKANEAMILKMRDTMVLEALLSGKDVVVDDTNFEPKHEARLRELMPHGTNFSVEYVDTPYEECIKRDLNRLNSVGDTVIRRMYRKYVRVIETPKEADTRAVIIDIDGTLAHMVDRSPYDYTKVSEDTVDPVLPPILEAMKTLTEAYNGNMKFLIVSGRDDTCREDTEKWLAKYGIYYDRLLMRDSTLVDKKGNKLPDTIIKEQIYETEINGKYHVNVVFDDRQQVVDMWRRKGLVVYQVAEGDF